MAMGRAGWWVTGLAGAAVAVLAGEPAVPPLPPPGRVVEAPVLDGAGRLEDTLEPNLPVLLVVELEPPRRLNDEERRVIKKADLVGVPPPALPVRLLKTFSVQIGEWAVDLPPQETAGLLDLTGIRAWRQGGGVHCRLEGRDGKAAYAVTFAFMPVRDTPKWVLASRTFSLVKSARQETRRETRSVDLQTPGAAPGRPPRPAK